MPTKHYVEIKTFSYKPKTLEIIQGDTVEWENKDTVKHTVTDKSGTFSSDDLLEGDKYSRTFDAGPATVQYECTYHRGMEGTVTVKEATDSKAAD